MEKQELITLVSALKKGQKDAAGPIYDAYYNDIYFFILKIVKDPYLASDLTQDTFVEVLETIEKLRIPSAFPSWCKMIAYHKCTTYFKKRKDLLADEKHEDYYLLDMRMEERTEFLPDASIDQDELKQTICGILDSLPEEQRAAILMRYYDEISIKDIATIQNVSPGTVMSRLNYGRKSIKKSVLEYEEKHNVKLHCRGVVPLLLWFFHEDRLDKGISLTEMTPLAETVAALAEKATRTLFKKLAAAICASLLVTGGITGAASIQDKPADNQPGISTEGNTLPGSGNSENTEHTENSEDTQVSENTENSEDTEGSEDTENTENMQSSENTQNSEHIQDSENTQNSENTQGSGNNTNSENDIVAGNSPENPKQPEDASSDAIDIPAHQFPALTLSSDGTYYIVSGRGSATDSHIIVPSRYKGLPVREIGADAFYGNQVLSTITLPDTITHIRSHAFANSGLTEFDMPDSVIYVAEYAFSNCHRLKTLTLSNQLTKINSSSFLACYALERIVIPKSVTTFESGAFGSCTNLQSLTVEKGNPVYHSSGNCIIETASKTLIQGISTSQIPSDGSVTTIDSLAFYNTEHLTSITIPEGITSIKLQAFDYCANLTSVYLPLSLTEVGSWGFTNNESLTDVYYAGSIAQWTSTFPTCAWFLPENHTVTIHCTDGDITNP